MDVTTTWRRQELEESFRAAVDQGRLPHIAAMAASGPNQEEAWSFSYGARALDDPSPLTTDTVIWLASMTKLVVVTAALQLVERGALSLDAPLSELLPLIGKVVVLEGFDARGQAITRPPRTPVTLRHLLSHTAGYSYSTWNDTLGRYHEVYGIPQIFECREITLTLPLMFDPGTSWEYGISMDWVGKAVEAASGKDLESYVQEHILGPLGMSRTSFILDERMRADLAGMHSRAADGTLSPMEFEVNQDREFFMSGGSMYGSTRDYFQLLRAYLGGGSIGDARILERETIMMASRNQIGDLSIGPMVTYDPASSNDVTLMPHMGDKWSLLGLVNSRPGPNGRSAGSMFWTGMANCFYWVDWQRGDVGLFCTQVLPFVDEDSVGMFERFERAVHGGTA